jgi:hypothetical protein
MWWSMTSTDGNPWFYPDVVSAAPGDPVKIHASSVNGTRSLIVTRVGAERDQVARFDGIDVSAQPIPESADSDGCGWEPVHEFCIGDDWASGYYDLALVDSEGSSMHHFVCVRPAESAVKASAAIVLNTNTYHA